MCISATVSMHFFMHLTVVSYLNDITSLDNENKGTRRSADIFPRWKFHLLCIYNNEITIWGIMRIRVQGIYKII